VSHKKRGGGPKLELWSIIPTPFKSLKKKEKKKGLEFKFRSIVPPPLVELLSLPRVVWHMNHKKKKKKKGPEHEFKSIIPPPLPPSRYF